jgi:hypothetical protein
MPETVRKTSGGLGIRTERADGTAGWYKDDPGIDRSDLDGQTMAQAMDVINAIYARRGARMGLFVMAWIDQVA